MWLIVVAVVLVLGVVLHRLNKDFSLLAMGPRIKRVGGGDLNDLYPVIPGKTIFGNNFDILTMTPEKVFNYVIDCIKYSGGRSFVWLFMQSAVFNACRPEDVETALNHPALLQKGAVYALLNTFLGEGLLTSTGKKWHAQRKVLTPAFHFNVLQSFVEIFKEESQKFLKVLDENLNVELSLDSIIPRFTLNNICETAMGVKLDNMADGDVYRTNINGLERRMVMRAFNPLYYFDIIYKLFGDYAEYTEHLKKVQEFTTRVVNKRREDFQKGYVTNDATSCAVGQKKRYAMLDTLLDAESKGLIDHKEICEEVDTFMFAGYDTTSTCLIFSLMSIAQNEAIQQKCYEEVRHLDDFDSLAVFDFNKLEYLECVIKESLRLYPSVPFVARGCAEEIVLNGVILPKLAQFNMHLFHIHRDPRHFPDPEKFDPDRFLPENTINRHPYAFIPFSAGPRNCIGQKFAMLEIKVLLARIVKNYKLFPVTRVEDIVFENGIILRTKEDVKIKVVKRT